MKIYTKKGDKGTSALFFGDRSKKFAPVFCALGTLDELNASIGVTLSRGIEPEQLVEQLVLIQSSLFELGALLAQSKHPFNDRITLRLEEWIDAIEEELPPLKNFILPGGVAAAAELHLTRAISRRAERELVQLYDETALPEGVLPFLNRLSDYLFVAARRVNHEMGGEEIIWRPE